MTYLLTYLYKTDSSRYSVDDHHRESVDYKQQTNKQQQEQTHSLVDVADSNRYNTDPITHCQSLLWQIHHCDKQWTKHKFMSTDRLDVILQSMTEVWHHHLQLLCCLRVNLHFWCSLHKIIHSGSISTFDVAYIKLFTADQHVHLNSDAANHYAAAARMTHILPHTSYTSHDQISHNYSNSS